MTPTPVLRVEKILDNKTLIARGSGISAFSEGDAVFVLGESGRLEDGTPLVVPKARLKVSANAGAYLILESESRVEERRVTSTPGFSFPSMFGRVEHVNVKVPQRLNVRDKDMHGNPGSQPIVGGDVVIREEDFADYVSTRKSD